MDEFKVPEAVTVDAIKRLTKGHQLVQARELKRFRTMLDSVGQLSLEEQEMLGLRSELLSEVKEAQARADAGRSIDKGKTSRSSAPPNQPKTK